MDIRMLADVDVIAVEQDDKVSLMLELTAPVPSPEGAVPRAAATVQMVLDRSGSMMGEPLEAAKDALIKLVDRLDPADRFGLVTFDDEVDVVVPCGVVRDKRAVKQAIAAVHPGGSTNLAGGLMRGLQEARRAAGRAGATVIVLSDGQANMGETNPDRLGGVAAAARAHDVTTSTIGLGHHYDEALLATVAQSGDGNHTFAETADGAAAVLAGEVEGLLSTTVQAASVIVRPLESVRSVTIWNDLPNVAVEGGVMIELGDLWAGEQRKLVLTLEVPAMPALGLAEIASLELRYVALPEFVEQTVTTAVHVNVVPGDQAAGRIPDATVVNEVVFQQVQRAKRDAAQALKEHDPARAMMRLDFAAGHAAAAFAAAPCSELQDELDVLGDLRDRAARGDIEYSAKTLRSDASRKGRKRGRRDLRE